MPLVRIITHTNGDEELTIHQLAGRQSGSVTTVGSTKKPCANAPSLEDRGSCRANLPCFARLRRVALESRHTRRAYRRSQARHEGVVRSVGSPTFASFALATSFSTKSS